MALRSTLVLLGLATLTSALDQKLSGVNYDLRQGADWDPNKCKDAATIAADLKTLSQITSRVRTYALAGCDVATVLTEAKKLSMTVWLGVWVAKDDSVYKKELDALDKLLAASLIDENVVGFNVGSEAVYRNDITAEQAVQYVTDFKATLKKKGLSTPVSITDIADILVQYPTMIEASDVVTANQFPFWEKQEASGAAKQFLKRFQGLKKAAGSKKLIITETGWPTAGIAKNGSEASGPNAARYLNDFVVLAQEQKWDYYYFAGFDSPYKADQEQDKNTVEAHFGIYDENRVMKPEIAALSVKKMDSFEASDSSSKASDSKSANGTSSNHTSSSSKLDKKKSTKSSKTSSLVSSTAQSGTSDESDLTPGKVTASSNDGPASTTPSASGTKSSSTTPDKTKKDTTKKDSGAITGTINMALLSAVLSVVFLNL